MSKDPQPVNVDPSYYVRYGIFVEREVLKLHTTEYWHNLMQNSGMSMTGVEAWPNGDKLYRGVFFSFGPPLLALRDVPTKIGGLPRPSKQATNIMYEFLEQIGIPQDDDDYIEIRRALTPSTTFIPMKTVGGHIIREPSMLEVESRLIVMKNSKKKETAEEAERLNSGRHKRERDALRRQHDVGVFVEDGANSSSAANGVVEFDPQVQKSLQFVEQCLKEEMKHDKLRAQTQARIDASGQTLAQRIKKMTKQRLKKPRGVSPLSYADTLHSKTDFLTDAPDPEDQKPRKKRSTKAHTFTEADIFTKWGDNEDAFSDAEKTDDEEIPIAVDIDEDVEDEKKKGNKKDEEDEIIVKDEDIVPENEYGKDDYEVA